MWIKYAFVLIVMASLYSLVVLGKLDAQVYVGLVTSVLGAAGAHMATTWQPQNPSSNPQGDNK